MPRHFVNRLAVLLAGLAVVFNAHADDDDTRFLLEQSRRAAERRTATPEGELIAPPGFLVHQGKVLEVHTQPDQLEPAIQIAIDTGQWDRLEEFISRYRLMRDHRPALIAMAEGLLARHRGDYPLALQHMQSAHEAALQDGRIYLELARLQFEDNQDRAARDGFSQAMARKDMPQQARAMSQQYLQALDMRSRWHGSLAFGVGYNSNINQAAGGSQLFCLDFFPICYNRKLDDPISSNLINYELSMQRRFNVKGNHNLLMRPVAYGSLYRRKNEAPNTPIHNYSNNTAILYLGYNYLDARNNISVMPYIEHYTRDSHSHFLAKGMQLEWRRAIGSKWQIGSVLDAKRHHHTDWGQRTSGDFTQYQWGLSANYMPRANTSIYGGVDLYRKKYAVSQASSKDVSFRAGVYHAFPGKAGLYVNAMGVFRITRSDAHDGFLGERRLDRQQVYILTAGMEGLKIAGMTPELRLRRNINRSNIDWAYDFQQTEISLMLRRNF